MEILNLCENEGFFVWQHYCKFVIIKSVKIILSFILLISFSTSLVFSTIHHVIEDHHKKDKKCIAAELGETHFHCWEFEKCELCDLQLHSNFVLSKTTFFEFKTSKLKPYSTLYVDEFSSQEILSFSNRGPPVA